MWHSQYFFVNLPPKNLAVIQTSINKDLPMCDDRVSLNDKMHLQFDYPWIWRCKGYGWIA